MFPFFLVNLVPALCGIALLPFISATALGIIPATFAFAFVGSGLDSALRRNGPRMTGVLPSGETDCRLDFDLHAALTPELIAALVTLGVIGAAARSRSSGCVPGSTLPIRRAEHG